MRILVFLMMYVMSAAAFALPTLEDVEHAVHRGDYSAAESMTREVVTARPENAKAHYILAELLAHEGKSGEARAQAAEAKRLDPDIRFTSPDRFRQFEAQLNTRSSGVSDAPRVNNAADSGGGFGSLWVIVLIGAAVAFLFLRRRPSPAARYMPTYPPGPNGTPGAPGYGGPVYPPGSGLGGNLAAGLGGVATGMLAEHLIEGALDRRHEGGGANLVDGQTPAADPPAIDFGNGTDWGSDSGSSDSAGGFDGGSGGDWS